MLSVTRQPSAVNYQKKLHQRARQLRQTPTVTEAILWQQLKGANIFKAKFRRQWPIDRYIVDFCCLKSKLIIEIDGRVHDKHVAHDYSRDKILKQYGFKILRFSTQQIECDLEQVLNLIELSLSCKEREPEGEV